MAVRLDFDKAFSAGDFLDAVWNAVLKLYGEYGAGRTELKLIRYESEKKFAVVRTVHIALGIVRTALVSITRIGEEPVVVHVVAVSGTIEALANKTKMSLGFEYP